MIYRLPCSFTCFELDYVNTSCRYWDPYYYRRQRIQKENEGMNFVESVSAECLPMFYAFHLYFTTNYTQFANVLQVFSFVFGDGDPNQGIEEERWKLVIIEH